ncbi:hypothetical protein QTN25_000849 [Entamoeba marina]
MSKQVCVANNDLCSFFKSIKFKEPSLNILVKCERHLDVNFPSLPSLRKLNVTIDVYSRIYNHKPVIIEIPTSVVDLTINCLLDNSIIFNTVALTNIITLVVKGNINTFTFPQSIQNLTLNQKSRLTENMIDLSTSRLVNVTLTGPFAFKTITFPPTVANCKITSSEIENVVFTSFKLNYVVEQKTNKKLRSIKTQNGKLTFEIPKQILPTKYPKKVMILIMMKNMMMTMMMITMNTTNMIWINLF